MGTLQRHPDQLRSSWNDLEFWDEELSRKDPRWVPGQLLAGKGSLLLVFFLQVEQTRIHFCFLWI